jgi:hypothetical protein
VGKCHGRTCQIINQQKSYLFFIPNPHSILPECLLPTLPPFSPSQSQLFYLFAGSFLSYGYNQSSQGNSFLTNSTMSSWLSEVVRHHHHSFLPPTFYLCHCCDLLLYTLHEAAPVHGETYLLIDHFIVTKIASHLDPFSHHNTM